MCQRVWTCSRKANPAGSDVGVSAVAQILIVAFLVALPIFFPERLKTVLNMQVVPLAMPVTEVPVARRLRRL